MMNNFKKKLAMRKLALLVYDFDGVMTDNRVFVREDGMESVVCNRADGLGINIIKGLNIPQIILSTEQNPVVAARARKVGVPAIQGAGDKRQALLDYCAKNTINLEQVCFVGNDVNDLDAMHICGYKICPSDAHPDVLVHADLVVQAKGGAGVIRELAATLERTDHVGLQGDDTQLRKDGHPMARIKTVKHRLQESVDVKKALLDDDNALALIETMAADMTKCLKNGRKVIFAGNGGSFADAIHLAGEFVSRFTMERGPMAGLALGGNNSILTAVGNDYAFEDIFVRELKGLGQEGDLFLGISTSGNSPNIVKCMEAANDMRITCYGMTGQKQCRMDALGTCLKIPSSCTPRIQETHITVGHILCELVEVDLHG
jgi:D-sedoheptulose 7-phosphate isomerase